MEVGYKGKKKVFVCSPYRSDTEEGLRKNIDLALLACRVIASKGGHPLAPHLYFTTFLDDGNKKERRAGLRLAYEWLAMADEMWVVGGRISSGMQPEIDFAKKAGIRIVDVPDEDALKEMEVKNGFGY